VSIRCWPGYIFVTLVPIVF